MKFNVKVRAVLVGAGMLWAGAGHATALYDEEGTQLDIYGRIAMGVAGGGPDHDAAGSSVNNSPEFVDIYSRIGFRMRQRIDQGLTAFSRLEWRFTGDERRVGQAFSDTRQSYIGLESERFGTLQAGNFDSLYYQFVSLPFDVYLDRGLLFSSTGLQSRGDSIGYYTPEVHGFTSFLQLKHYSERGIVEAETSSEGSVSAAQGGVRYRQGPLSIGLGAVENTVRGGGNGEILYGLIGSYDIRDDLTVRLGVETQSDSSEYGGGFDSFGAGGTYTTGPWAFNADVYRVERDNQSNSNAWTIGAYYAVSENFDFLLEVAEADSPAIRASSDDVYWITGGRYLF